MFHSTLYAISIAILLGSLLPQTPMKGYQIQFADAAVPCSTDTSNTHCYEEYKRGDHNGIYAQSNVADQSISSYFNAVPVWVQPSGSSDWVELGAVKGVTGKPYPCNTVSGTQYFYMYWYVSGAPHCTLFGTASTGWHWYRLYDLSLDSDWEFEIDGVRKYSNLAMGFDNGIILVGGESGDSSNGLNGEFKDLFYITTYSGSESYTSTRFDSRTCVEHDTSNVYWINDTYVDAFKFGVGSSPGCS